MTPDPSEAKTELPEDFGKSDALTEQFNTYVAKLERENQSLRDELEQLKANRDTWRRRAQREHGISQGRIGLIWRILRRAKKVNYHDQGHVCDSRKAVEGIVQMINARKDDETDELTSLRKAAEAARAALESLVQKAHKHNWPTQYPDLYANAETALAGLRAELSPDR